jgi:hypothetical protein
MPISKKFNLIPEDRDSFTTFDIITAVHVSYAMAGLRKQSPSLYPKMFSFSGAFRQFSIFEKLASEAVPEIVRSARGQYDLPCRCD